MQQFLLPTSGGAPQIINIPVSLLSQTNQQPISFITANGQIFQLPNFSQLVVQQNADGTTTTSSAAGSGATNGTQVANGGTATTGQANAAGGAANNGQQQQQALVINHQGQLISLPVLQAAQQQVNTNTAGFTQQQQQQPQQTVNLSHVNLGSSNTATKLTLTTGTTPIKTLLEDDDKQDGHDGRDDHGPTIANIQLNNANSSLSLGVSSMNGGVSHPTHHATTVDGVNLDEIREFAKAFKLRRLALGLTQTQVGQALSATKGPAYSQSAICRFEKLDITPKSAAKIKPVLEKWMQEAELKYADRLKSGSQQNFADLLGSENAKKRKRRTSFTPQALEVLNDAFEKNTHPSGNQGADITMLANKLNIDREVIRVWFCNKRQALKNTVKKFRPNDSGSNDASLSPGSPSLSSLSSSGIKTQTIVTLASPTAVSLAPQPTTAAAAAAATASTTSPTIITLSNTTAAANAQLLSSLTTVPVQAKALETLTNGEPSREESKTLESSIAAVANGSNENDTKSVENESSSKSQSE